MDDRPEPTGWVGFVFFAGIMLLVIGCFNVIYGLVALFKDTYFVVTRAGLLGFDITTWGWITLILGIIEIFAGLAILGGQTWGRIVGIIVAFLSMLHQFSLMNANPLWSLLIIALDVVVIYALAAHGREMAS
jgi:hypothetical protein